MTRFFQSLVCADISLLPGRNKCGTPRYYSTVPRNAFMFTLMDSLHPKLTMGIIRATVLEGFTLLPQVDHGLQGVGRLSVAEIRT